MSGTKGRVLDDWTTKPVALTSLGPRYPGGRCRSAVDGTVWVYRALPLSPVTAAPTDQARAESMEPLFRALTELATLSVNGSKRRAMARANYREVHILAVNIDTAFRMPENHPLKVQLDREFSDRIVDRRLVMFGVRLRDKVGGGSEKIGDRIDAITQFLVDGQIPMGDFDQDYHRIDAILNRCGLLVPSADDFRLADAWWNLGRTADVPNLYHQDHFHVFHEPRSMRLAAVVGEDNCEDMARVPGQSAVTMASVSETSFNFDSPHSPRSHWVSALFQMDARSVSIRGLVEPPANTKDEIRRQKARYLNDISERRRQNKMERPEQEAMLGMLSVIEDHYGQEGVANPTLIDCSILVGMNGIQDLDQVDSKLPLTLVPMQLKQTGALAETWLCSPFRANPNLHDLPIQAVVASGITGLNFVGDRTGALLGQTESDHQLALIDPRAASNEDDLPMMLVVGATGSGKSMTLMKLATQFSDMDIPGVIVDPKQESDFAPGVLSHGGQVIELDDLASADGILDPLRLTSDPKEGQSLALSVLSQINPWGSMKGDYEQPLKYALNYGIQRGATCTGQALMIAQREIGHQLPPDMIARVLQSTESDPQVRAIIGMQPNTEPLSVSNGVTLIMVGNSNLDLPKDGRAETLSHRIALAMIRMLVFGSTFALTARGGGFIFLDEAWMFLQAGRDELKRLGRLARSQRVFPALFTQQISDASGADLEGYISRVLIGHIQNAREAREACLLAGLDPDDYVGRITLSGKMGSSHLSEGVSDENALKPVFEGKGADRRVKRGAIWYYRDLNRRCVPVEVALSEEFLALNSTNPLDQEKYREYRESVKQMYRRRMGHL